MNNVAPHWIADDFRSAHAWQRPGIARRAALQLVLTCLACVALSACGTTIDAVSKVTDFALEATGFKKPDVPADIPRVPRTVEIRFHAGDNLNAGVAGQPLALVVRVYKLRSASAFLQAPYETFLSAAREKDSLGAELVDAREVQLVPGQKLESVEKIPRDVPYVGVVALFQAPVATRWHFVFDAETAETSGITIGAHACALTVTKGQPTGSPLGDPSTLGGARCPS